MRNTFHLWTIVAGPSHGRSRRFTRHRSLAVESLEMRLPLATTPITCSDANVSPGCVFEQAADHRWPSINDAGDIVYSAQVNGKWEVFELSAGAASPVQRTNGDFNKMYPAIANNGDITFFKEGGSGGIGWQVIRQTSGGGESVLEMSSRNVANGAHRNAGKYSSISSNGITISSFDFYSCGSCAPVRRFNVSDAGRLDGDFLLYNYPDINASHEIVYSGFGQVRKASVSNAYPGEVVAAGTMARINNSGDLVVVSGNLEIAGTIRLVAAPNYADSTVVADGSWADINNSGQVVYEGFDSNGVRQIYLWESGKPELEMVSAERVSPGLQRFDYRYSVANEAADEFRVGIYLSDDKTFELATDELLLNNAFTVIPEADREPNADGTAKTYDRRLDIGENVLETDPGRINRKYLLAVADDEANVDEVENDNNVAVICGPADVFVADFPVAQVIPANNCNFNDSRGSIDTIVLHAITASAASGIREFQNPTLKSAHYIVASNGSVTQMVPESKLAFHTAASNYNQRSVGIEHEDGGHPQIAGEVNPDPAWVTDALLRSSARLVADIARDNGIPLDRSHIIGHEEVQENRGDPGPHWPWGKYMQLVSGAPGTRAINVGLPEVEIRPDWEAKGDFGVRYAPLGINFEAVEPTNGALWTAESNEGTLEIFLKDFNNGNERLVARSTGIATLSLYAPGTVPVPPASELLTGEFDPANHLIEWHTPGFTVDLFGLIPYAMDPVTRWVEPEDISLRPSRDVLFDEIVRNVEAFIHSKMAHSLSDVTFLGLINDPGDTTMLVTSPSGARTGVVNSTLVTNIPGSAYFDSGPAVLIINPAPQPYHTQLTGVLSGDVLIVTALADLSAGLDSPPVRSRSVVMQVQAGQTISYQMTMDASSSNVEVISVLPGDANFDGNVDSEDFTAWNANKFQTETSWARGDFNSDGVTDASDFNIWNEHKFQDTNPPQGATSKRTPRAPFPIHVQPVTIDKAFDDTTSEQFVDRSVIKGTGKCEGNPGVVATPSVSRLFVRSLHGAVLRRTATAHRFQLNTIDIAVEELFADLRTIKAVLDDTLHAR